MKYENAVLGSLISIPIFFDVEVNLIESLF